MVHYNNGFLPTSLLSSEWPADKLPPNGLEVANLFDIYNHLPDMAMDILGGSKYSKDWYRMHGDCSDLTAASTSAEFGTGLTNSKAINSACLLLGEGWYLPSEKEMKNLLTYWNPYLGQSYNISDKASWSSTYVQGQGQKYVWNAGSILKPYEWRSKYLCVRNR